MVGHFYLMMMIKQFHILAEGTWQWVTGEPFSYTQWHEGEPNNVENEDCLSMSSQDGYDWMDLGCETREHGGVMHYAVCQNNKG